MRSQSCDNLKTWWPYVAFIRLLEWAPCGAEQCQWFVSVTCYFLQHCSCLCVCWVGQMAPHITDIPSHVTASGVWNPSFVPVSHPQSTLCPISCQLTFLFFYLLNEIRYVHIFFSDVGKFLEDWICIFCKELVMPSSFFFLPQSLHFNYKIQYWIKGIG